MGCVYLAILAVQQVTEGPDVGLLQSRRQAIRQPHMVRGHSDCLTTGGSVRGRKGAHAAHAS